MSDISAASPSPLSDTPAEPLPRLCAIVDHDAALRAGMTVPDVARAYLDGGARFLQLRAKNAPSGQFLAWTEAIAALAREAGARLVINDRFDIALLAGVAGLHVGQDDLSVDGIRRWLGPAACIGLSTHTDDQVDDALRQPISYLAIGPVFGTRSKETGYEPLGLARVRETAQRVAASASASASAASASASAPASAPASASTAASASPSASAPFAAAAVPLPIVAIGGITLDNARSVIDAGASCVAVIGDLLSTGDPAARVAAFVQRLRD